MNLARFARRRYTVEQTPIEKLSRFSKAINGPDIYIKRDDLLGLTAGGNKTRKLEFLVADALKKGADTLITSGAVQSNHCRLTLSAAVKEGMKCRLVLNELIPGSYDPEAGGNIFLFHLLGTENIEIVSHEEALDAAVERHMKLLAEEGRTGYVIPMGGSNPIGATGYVACAQEIQDQIFNLGMSMDAVVCASGSSGTQAGLVTGMVGCNMNIPVIGINVGVKEKGQADAVYELVTETADHLGISTDIPRSAVICFDDYMGPGYSLPTPEMAKAVRLLAETEGILLDPVYTGKTMAGLIDLSKKGYFRKNQNVLFLHTGGVPALPVYRHYLLAHQNCKTLS
ncbi:MAG: D-cysteine desulfhydrase [Deltaproteobacteria bacterium]|jgi:D-cysteine desulfhydrase|nr:D-cysteine desulfhydrase [Deltaproteobacteria bacterium]